MKGQFTFKPLKPYSWILLPMLGVILGVLLGIVLLKTKPQRSPSPIASPTPVATPTLPVAPTPTASPTAAASPSPSPSASSTPKQVKPRPSAPSPAPLTAEQQALNRRNTEQFLSSLPSVDSMIEMRVVIAEGVPSITIRPSMDAIVVDESGKTLTTLSAGSTYTAQPSGNSIRLNGTRLPGKVMIDPSPNGLLNLGDRTYRGRLNLMADAGSLWGISFVNMRSYLYSVVGSEVSPSWNMEALKAQAVAARSYALTYHFDPAHSAYDLGATQRYQVYSGIEREADRIRQAVDATAGEYVSYRGGIVQSLYAASDDIVMEVFKGQGMSQLGALNLANQGYMYQQILNNYYPGTKVGRIELDMS